MCIIAPAIAGGVTAAIAANAALVAAAASSGIAIAGAVQQGKDAKKAAEYDAQIAEYEAEVARQAGEVENIKFGVNARRQFGRQIAVMAASNVDLSFGSASERLAETRKFQAFDSDILARNTYNAVLGLTLKAENSRIAGQNAASAASFNAASAGLSGLSSIAGIGFQAARGGGMGALNTGTGVSDRVASKYGGLSAEALIPTPRLRLGAGGFN